MPARARRRGARKTRRTELVARPVTPHGQLIGRARVKIARREAAQPVVAEARVALLPAEVLEREAYLVHRILVLGLAREVDEGVVERAAYEGPRNPRER